MQVFAALGAAVERDWARAKLDRARLPAIAAEALRAVDLGRLDPLAIAEELATRDMPEQLPVLFGDAQVTAWRGQHVLVQLIYWLDDTTAIHQHGFAGAFRVLAGASLHTAYAFSPDHESPGFRLGRLRRDHQEVLTAGDTREIGPGGALIHNLIHLERPSVTLTVRTPWVPELAPQWLYHPPGVAVDPRHDDVELRTRIRLFDACARVDPARGARVARAIMKTGVAASWALLTAIGARASDEALAPYLAMAGKGPTGKLLVDAIQRWRVRRRLFGLRDRAVKREHRVLLALLADGADRGSILDAIHRLFPGRPPAERIETWLRELRAPLGLSLDRQSARVLRRIIEGVSARDIAAELDGYAVREVTAIARAFAQSPLFAPLVTASAAAAPKTSRSR